MRPPTGVAAPEKKSLGHLFDALSLLGMLQRRFIDRLALQEAVQSAEQHSAASAQLHTIAQQFQLQPARWLSAPDPALLPLLMFHPDEGWRVLTALKGPGQWVAQIWVPELNRSSEALVQLKPGHAYASLSWTPRYRAAKSPVVGLILDELTQRKRVLWEAAVGGAFIAIASLMTSLYSMQVYDRVIPTAGHQTLLVLSLGIVLAIAFEFLARRLRAHLYEQLINEVDEQLARSVFLRFLAIRLDQLPQSVGSFAGQLRGYERVRAFLLQLTSFFLVDAPFALIFVGVIYYLAGALALVPVLFLLVSVGVGLWHRGEVLALAARQHAYANLKTGLIVEAIEGAEVIKSGQAGWRFLGRWLSSSQEGRDAEWASRRISEQALHLAMSFQQLAYVAIVAIGSVSVMQGQLSLGGLIACTILAGRILNPIAQVCDQLVQWGHAKAALQELDLVWALEGDHPRGHIPITPKTWGGHYRGAGLQYFAQGLKTIDVPELILRPGERIALIGPVGAGKTTLLRLLSGMYKAQQGRLFLDDIDLQHLDKSWLSEHIGYLPQDARLFAGTLRDNLLLGLLDPGDAVVLDVARQTGLMAAVIAPHPMGLDQPIFEGGKGYSGGQRQLIQLTRVFLRKPSVWLLDEPTASLDRNHELATAQAIHAALRPSDTLVLVTHKPELLQLVQRILVIAGGRIVMDGPRDAVLTRLQTPPKETAA